MATTTQKQQKNGSCLLSFLSTRRKTLSLVLSLSLLSIPSSPTSLFLTKIHSVSLLLLPSLPPSLPPYLSNDDEKLSLFERNLAVGVTRCRSLPPSFPPSLPPSFLCLIPFWRTREGGREGGVVCLYEYAAH